MFRYRTFFNSRIKNLDIYLEILIISTNKASYHCAIASRTNLSQMDILIDHFITIFILNMPKRTVLL
jgi:hypothetical protein